MCVKVLNSCGTATYIGPADNSQTVIAVYVSDLVEPCKKHLILLRTSRNIDSTHDCHLLISMRSLTLREIGKLFQSSHGNSKAYFISFTLCFHTLESTRVGVER